MIKIYLTMFIKIYSACVAILILAACTSVDWENEMIKCLFNWKKLKSEKYPQTNIFLRHYDEIRGWWMKIVINSITSVYHDTHSNELDIDFEWFQVLFLFSNFMNDLDDAALQREQNLLSGIISIDIQMLLDL